MAQAEAGKEAVIVRRGEPVVGLFAYSTPSKRQPEVLMEKVIIPDSFFKLSPEKELEAWEGG